MPVAQTASRSLMMPKRRRTRAAERAQHIQNERKLNAAYNAQFTQPAATEVEQHDKPPPF